MWTKISFWNAIEWCKEREVVSETMNEHPPGEWPGSGIVLHDGTKVVGTSSWNGPLSEVTPDVDANPPEFWLWIPEAPPKVHGDNTEKEA